MIINLSTANCKENKRWKFIRDKQTLTFKQIMNYESLWDNELHKAFCNNGKDIVLKQSLELKIEL